MKQAPISTPGVEVQDRREEDRVERAVMKTRRFESSERVTERVHGAEPLLERFRPGRHVAPVRTRRVDVSPDAARSIEGDRCGRGAKRGERNVSRQSRYHVRRSSIDKRAAG
jgi:hypothetical protein